MATLSFTIDNDVLAELVDEICHQQGYDQHKQNGETKNQFARRMLIADMRSRVVSHRARLVLAAAAEGIAQPGEQGIQ